MALNEVMNVSLGGGAVTVDVTYNTSNLQLNTVTYQNLSSSNAVVEVSQNGAVVNSFPIPANTPQTQLNVAGQHIQLVQVTIQKASGPVTIVDWPDGQSVDVRWPA